ncbi:MAG: Hsp20/alpha crystallin family protein [Planctomycetaceae bacterium]
MRRYQVSGRLPLRGGFPFPLEEIRDEMDRLWTSLTAAPPLHGWGVRVGSHPFPAINLRESEDALLVEAELPGLSVGDVDVSVTGEELVIKGARPATTKLEAATSGQAPTWHRRERGEGGFERRIELPFAVDPDKVEASLVDGVLTLRCPKAAACQPRKIDVRGS